MYEEVSLKDKFTFYPHPKSGIPWYPELIIRSNSSLLFLKPTNTKLDCIVSYTYASSSDIIIDLKDKRELHGKTLKIVVTYLTRLCESDFLTTDYFGVLNSCIFQYF